LKPRPVDGPRMTEPFDDDVYRRRTERVQAALADAGADAAVLFPSSNLHYLSGFEEEPAERHLFLFVPGEGDPAFVVPALYDAQVRRESWVADVRAYGDDEDPMAVVEAVLDDLGATAAADAHVLVDDSMWATFTQDLRGALPDASWGLASEAVGPVRMRRDDA